MGQGANESAAESSAGWFSDICDHHPDGLLVADDQGLIVYVNARAARIVGVSASELLGQDIRKAIPLQEYDGRSWWECTDPWNGLAIRSGHREKLLIIPGMREVLVTAQYLRPGRGMPVSYTHLRAHETRHDLVCRLLLEKKKSTRQTPSSNTCLCLKKNKKTHKKT